jgi:hypothetical protein
MMCPIRGVSLPVQDVVPEDLAEAVDDRTTAEDPGLDVLVRHAIRQELASHDGGRVWKQLSKRVKGPFGSIAVEEPALRGLSMPRFEDSPQTADLRPDSMRHSLFRTAEATFSMR